MKEEGLSFYQNWFYPRDVDWSVLIYLEVEGEDSRLLQKPIGSDGSDETSIVGWFTGTEGGGGVDGRRLRDCRGGRGVRDGGTLGVELVGFQRRPGPNRRGRL